jgi:hypothetical protein
MRVKGFDFSSTVWSIDRNTKSNDFDRLGGVWSSEGVKCSA